MVYFLLKENFGILSIHLLAIFSLLKVVIFRNITVFKSHCILQKYRYWFQNGCITKWNYPKSKLSGKAQRRIDYGFLINEVQLADYKLNILQESSEAVVCSHAPSLRSMWFRWNTTVNFILCALINFMGGIFILILKWNSLITQLIYFARIRFFEISSIRLL